MTPPFMPGGGVAGHCAHCAHSAHFAHRGIRWGGVPLGLGAWLPDFAPLLPLRPRMGEGAVGSGPRPAHGHTPAANLPPRRGLPNPCAASFALYLLRLSDGF
jgi:hypothetical protein